MPLDGWVGGWRMDIYVCMAVAHGCVKNHNSLGQEWPSGLGQASNIPYMYMYIWSGDHEPHPLHPVPCVTVWEVWWAGPAWQHEGEEGQLSVTDWSGLSL